MSREQRRAIKSVTRKADRSAAWEPLQRSEYVPYPESQVLAMMSATGFSRARIVESLEMEGRYAVWINGLYQVQVRPMTGEGNEGWTHLNIRRRDGKAIFRDWRHFQEIKNQLCGLEREAVELYPAESRLTDTSNKYHLWVAPSGYRFPFGFQTRDVMEPHSTFHGIRQR